MEDKRKPKINLRRLRKTLKLISDKSPSSKHGLWRLGFVFTKCSAKKSEIGIKMVKLRNGERKKR